MADFRKILQDVVSPLIGVAGLVVDIKTQITPDIHLNIEEIVKDAATESEGGDGPPFILSVIKPKVTIIPRIYFQYFLINFSNCPLSFSTSTIGSFLL